MHQTMDLNDVFEEEILQITDKDEDLLCGKVFAKNFRNKCFIKTKFHDRFVEKMTIARMTSSQKQTLVGIEGLGKSSSAIYYVLSCRKKGDNGIHYIDLNVIEAIDKNLEKFKLFADSVTCSDCLVVDHVTLFNMPLVKKIEEVTQYTQIILIESGFTACAHTSTGVDFGKNLQIDLNEFKKIWTGSLSVQTKGLSLFLEGHKGSSLFLEGHKVYHELKNQLIVTPKLLHSTLDDMMLHNLKTEAVLYSAKCRLREEIAIFNLDVKNTQEERFILDTKTLLELIKNCDEGFTTTIFTLQEFKIPINIFDVQINVVTKQALKENYRLFELELEEGDVYVVISELQPSLHSFWIEKVPLNYKEVMSHTDNFSKDVFRRIIFYGGMQIEFETALVKFQTENNIVFVPDRNVFMDTNSFETSGECAIKQCIGIIKQRHGLQCLKPDQDKLIEYSDESTDRYDKPLRNVHRTALFLKEEIKKNRDQTLLVYPSVQNLVGFSYFLYTAYTHSQCGINKETCSSVPVKRKRNEGTLFLVRVATGFSHTGLTMHKALEVFQNTLKEVSLHAVVLIATHRSTLYTLTGNCGFKHLSVVNIGHQHYLKYLNYCLEEEHYLVIDAILSSSDEVRNERIFSLI
ncbi:uncharacterized protein LOC127705314 [Mytilus californianus]|uniref:uncharacterized protein LOC127705314 n=1 Tax=Mytilus californianus TaxID=6549 RepID=UPI0022469720|nr:uncharacterized protein LOC127705314 [Mytilus californianus]